MAKIPKSEMPAYVRRCFMQWQTATKRNREEERERLRFYCGGDLQWRDDELTKRRNQQRPWVTINRVKPAVDQVEGDIRLNPPGPQVHPVGGGADADTADIIEGLIREVEYRSNARTAYSTAGKYSAVSGYAVLELATEYVSEDSFAQQLVIKSVEDPEMVFFDPTARRANREDAGWAGKLKMYSKSEYMAAFGRNCAVLRGRQYQRAAGWIQDAIGIEGSLAQINEWTGPKGEGPYYVAEFYCVESDPTKLILYSDGISRFKDESVPEGVEPDPDAEPSKRERRTITKYVVDALEVLDETEWLDPKTIPLIPVLGPEVYIDGKLHRLSLIAGALDPQRALNYVVTTGTELVGAMPKSPWIGAKGSFDDPRWQTANSQMWAYLEYTPVFVTDETTGGQQLAPAPQRNQWEAPIQWLLALAAYFSDSIKAVTSIFDPSLGAQKGDQSGRAIEQLRSESSVGNYSYSDNLHRAIGIMYGSMVRIFPKILDGPRAVTIVQPDSQHEVTQINQEFQGGIDPKTGKPGKSNNITLGIYSCRVVAGPSFETRQENAIATLTDFFKVAPQALAAPGVASKFLRMVGEGNPQVEGMADLLAPQTNQQGDPAQLGQKLQQAAQQNQALTMLVQKMQQALQAKLPEIEAKKWVAAVQAIAGIREAEIKAGVDRAEMDISHLETLTGFAHEAATQAAEHEHAATIQQAQQRASADSQQRDHAHADQSQAADHENAKDAAVQQAALQPQQPEPTGEQPNQ